VTLDISSWLTVTNFQAECDRALDPFDGIGWDAQPRFNVELAQSDCERATGWTSPRVLLGRTAPRFVSTS
jgi:hypothetical protein